MAGSDWFWYGADVLCGAFSASVVYRFKRRMGVKVPALRRVRDPAKVAEKLLLEFLTPKQKKEWKEGSQFRYKNPRSGRDYIIGGNPFTFQEARGPEYRARGYGPIVDIPMADAFLCQLLSLMANEDEVQRVACG